MLSDKSDKNIENLNRGVEKMFQHFTQPGPFSAGSHSRAANKPHANGALKGKGI